jgi:hypothetical protein
MQVRCPRCQTPRELAQRPALDSAISVTCASCGQVFRVRGKARTASILTAVAPLPPPLPPEEPVEPPGAEPTAATWRVRRVDGTILEFPNLRIFQKWVAEGAVTLGDAISRNARPFRPITEIPELVGLFERAEQVRAQASASRVTPVPPELPATPPPEAPPEPPRSEPAPGPDFMVAAQVVPAAVPVEPMRASDLAEVAAPLVERTPPSVDAPPPEPDPAPAATRAAPAEPATASSSASLTAPEPDVAPSAPTVAPTAAPHVAPTAAPHVDTAGDWGDRTLTDSRLEGLDELRRAEAASFAFDRGPAPVDVFTPGPPASSVFDPGPSAPSVFDPGPSAPSVFDRGPGAGGQVNSSPSWSPSRAELAGFLDEPAASTRPPSGPASGPVQVDEDELFGNTMQLKSSDIAASLGASAPAPISFDTAPRRGVAHPPLDSPSSVEEPARAKTPNKRWLWIALSAVAIGASGFAAWFVFGRATHVDGAEQQANGDGGEHVAKAPPARAKRPPPRRDPEEEQRAGVRALVLYAAAPAQVPVAPEVASADGGERPKAVEPKAVEPKVVEPKTVEPKVVEKPKPGEAAKPPVGEKPPPVVPVTPTEVTAKPPTDGYDALLADASAAEQSGRLAEAVSLLGKAAAMNPSSVEPIAKLAWVYLKLGDSTNAILKFQEAKRRNPGYRDTYVGLAKALELSGRTSEAIDIYRQFLRLCPACKKAESVKQALVRLGATP